MDDVGGQRINRLPKKFCMPYNQRHVNVDVTPFNSGIYIGVNAYRCVVHLLSSFSVHSCLDKDKRRQGGFNS